MSTRKIDGRKAEITNKMKEYTTYRAFAVKHGYPDAAVVSDSDDPRKPLQNGDVVTLLTSGTHESDDRYTVWVVEAANGERHLIGEEGLRILDEDHALNDEITVLPDESLGGVLREYREVKRKADVGELVKTTGKSGHEPYEIGEVLLVIKRWDTYVCFEEYDVGARDFTEYVVLEPTDIIRVGDERLRMVDRKAAVGERIIITKSDDSGKPIGMAGVCTLTDEFDDGSIDAILNNGADIFIDRNRQDYRVLEPVRVLGQDYDEFIAKASEIPELSSRPATDQIAENIANLQAQNEALSAKIDALEAAIKRMNTQLRVAREDIVLIEDGVADDIAELHDKVAALEKAQYNTPQPVYAIPRMSGKTFPVALKTPQQVRDEIVERAKADVKDLIEDAYGGCGFDNGRFPALKYVGHVKIKFEVNRNKRKVTALGYNRYTGGGHPRIVGRAKCAPNDVFNAHIGRAIALRRALGLEVPAEYLSVPAPETVRVGDVVRETVSGVLGAVDRIEGAKVYGKYESGRNMHTTFYEIYDDTREEAELPVSSAQKGAAA